jgi:flagellin
LEGGFTMKIDNSIQNTYQQLASMKRINQASDDPAGSAISEKLQSQTKGFSKGIENSESMNDLLRTAEAGTSSIQDNLQKIRELAIRASSGMMTKGDKEIIQKQIEQYKSGIEEISRNAEFNTQKLLDGSFKNKSVSSDPSGNGSSIEINPINLESLGVKDFDVTEDFNIKDIDQAVQAVSSERSNIGATMNRINSSIQVNMIARENLEAANSKIADLDIESSLAKLNLDKVIQQYQYFTKKETLQQKAGLIDFMK